MSELQNILELVKNNYKGQMWYGNNLSHTLSDIGPDIAFSRPFADSHNIAELLAHLIAWRCFVAERVKGNAEYAIEIDSEQDWPVYDKPDAALWQQLRDKLQQSQTELEAAIGNASDELLGEPVPNAPFNFYVLLHGVVHHDIYHAAQIVLVKKQLNEAIK